MTDETNPVSEDPTVDTPGEPTPAPAPAPQIKYALSIAKDFDVRNATIADVVSKIGFLAPRPECETDTMNLQLIPYICFEDNTGPVPKYFIYERGQGSGEGRLVGNVSIGAGGHVEELPGFVVTPATDTTPEVLADLAWVVAHAGVLETGEEVGMTIDIAEFLLAINGDKSTDLGDDHVVDPYRVFPMFTDENPVSAVHLALAFVVKATPESFGEMEEGIITKGTWQTLEEIKGNHANGVYNLELWSQLLIRHLEDAIVTEA